MEIRGEVGPGRESKDRQGEWEWGLHERRRKRMEINNCVFAQREIRTSKYGHYYSVIRYLYKQISVTDSVGYTLSASNRQGRLSHRCFPMDNVTLLLWTSWQASAIALPPTLRPFCHSQIHCKPNAFSASNKPELRVCLLYIDIDDIFPKAFQKWIYLLLRVYPCILS